MTDLRALLGGEWFLQSLVTLLTHEDAICLTLLAVECGLEFVRHTLLFKALPIAPISTQEVAKYAAARGWWHLLVQLPLNNRGKHQEAVSIASNGHETALKRCQRLHTLDFPAHVLFAAVRRGVMEEVEWLHRCTRYDPEEAIMCAAKARQLGVLKWLVVTPEAETRGFKLLVRLEDSSLNVVCWQYTTFERTLVYCATAEHGLLPPRLYVPDETESSWVAFAELEYVSGQVRYPLMDFAAKSGNLEYIKRLQNDPVGSTLYFQAMCSAIQAGHLDIVRWLHKHRPEHPESPADLLSAAAQKDQVRIMDWVETQYDLTDSISTAYTMAISTQAANATRWLVDKFADTLCQVERPAPNLLLSFPPDLIEQICAIHGFKMNLSFLHTVASLGEYEVMHWLLQQDNNNIDEYLPHQEDRSSLLISAIHGKNLEIVRWCVEELGSWSNLAFKTSVVCGALPLAKYLHEKTNERMEIDTSLSREQLLETQARLLEQLLIEAIRCRFIEIVEWLVEELGAWSVFGLQYAAGSNFSYLVEKTRQRAQAGNTTLMAQNPFSDHRILVMLLDRSGVEDDSLEWVLENYPDTDITPATFSAEPFLMEPERPWHVFRKVLRYRPGMCVRWSRFPSLAVQFGSLADLQRLEVIGHPDLFTQETLDKILKFSRDEAVMRWFLDRFGSPVSNRVLEWTARYGAAQLLEAQLESRLNGPAEISVDAMQQKRFDTMVLASELACIAAEYEHTQCREVLTRWIHAHSN
ncbi:hypothetical protein Poli38472_010112 [Pythium oligandrum]|uniref:Uncharacterized protein n=1 Tax=Pythium oligandrum TaxID=41045 RepID=A0A8K1C9B5_PYTOL|nr:hypothetical protein Poli38472_010112 [Pythium oligandrum]|eukprot:TMW58553.1 hypothetical protein Poli38472_010112 [Pythium oligandrum]